jgi:hypothetical protein
MVGSYVGLKVVLAWSLVFVVGDERGEQEHRRTGKEGRRGEQAGGGGVLR